MTGGNSYKTESRLERQQYISRLVIEGVTCDNQVGEIQGGRKVGKTTAKTRMRHNDLPLRGLLTKKC